MKKKAFKPTKPGYYWASHKHSDGYLEVVHFSGLVDVMGTDELLTPGEFIFYSGPIELQKGDKKMDQCFAELEQAKAACAELIELVKQVEYTVQDYGTACPWCDGVEIWDGKKFRIEHMKDCPRQAALEKYKGYEK
jgi:hypothetical protein